jgi:hypothetical protein
MVQDMLATDVVFAALDEALFDEIDRAAEYGLEFFLHANEVVESPGGIGCKGDQDIDVTVGSEIVAQNRTEKGELGNFPTEAEVSDPLS